MSILDVFTVCTLDHVARVREDRCWITRLKRHLDGDSLTGRKTQRRLSHITVYCSSSLIE